MLIWKGKEWSTCQIETETALFDDLPKTTKVIWDGKPYTFVLAGRCGDMPLYQQL